MLQYIIPAMKMLFTVENFMLVFREGCYTGYSSAIYGGLASEDVPLMYGDSVGLGVTADGFQLLNSRNCALNLSGYKYSFAVFA